MLLPLPTCQPHKSPSSNPKKRKLLSALPEGGDKSATAPDSDAIFLGEQQTERILSSGLS